MWTSGIWMRLTMCLTQDCLRYVNTLKTGYSGTRLGQTSVHIKWVSALSGVFYKEMLQSGVYR